MNRVSLLVLFAVLVAGCQSIRSSWPVNRIWPAEAADAEPSLRNLSQAAEVAAEVDPEQARAFATAALEALEQARASDPRVDDPTAASVHLACARTFLALGQVAVAREQAERANKLAPTNQVRALLNSIKLT